MYNLFAKIFESPEALKDFLDKDRNSLGTVVFTNGCFDLLHRGHVEYLARARELGDCLVVGLNSDESVKNLKGPKRPLQSQADRAMILASLRSVDFVTIFNDSTPIHTLQLLKPDIHTKGGDYSSDTLPESETVRSYGGQITILPFLPGKSTTSIVQRMH